MKYCEYETEGEKVFRKMRYKEPLTEDDLRVIQQILQDPLQEFCKREAPFRLTEFFGIANEEVDQNVLKRTEEVIRGTIDNDEELYDLMDYNIKECLDEGGVQINGRL